jgi:hypothetical protein
MFCNKLLYFRSCNGNEEVPSIRKKKSTLFDAINCFLYIQKHKGTEGLIEIENPNLVKPKNIKAKDIDVSGIFYLFTTYMVKYSIMLSMSDDGDSLVTCNLVCML